MPNSSTSSAKDAGRSAAPVAYTTLSVEEQQRILQLQQDMLVSVAHGGDPQEIARQICLLAEQLLPNAVGTVMLLDEAREFLDVYAAPSLTPEGVARLNKLRPGPGEGSCGNAVFHDAPQFVQDTLADSRWQNLRDLANDFNLCACWSMPIRSHSGIVMGSFALSSFEHRSPGNFHRKILEIGASIIGIVLDRSESQKALRHSEEKYARLVEDIGDNFVIFSHTLDGTLTYVSAGVESVFGIGSDDVLYKTWDVAVHWKPGCVERVQRLLIELAEGEDNYLQHEMQFIHADGRERIIQVSEHAVRDAEGQVLSLEGIVEDITERKLAEARMARDHEQQGILRELLEISLAPQPLAILLRQCLDRLMVISWLSILSKSAIFLTEEDGRSLTLVASHALCPEIQSLCSQVALGQCLCGRAAASGQMLFAHRMDERHTTRFEDMDDHGHYIVPLKFGKQVLGVLALYLPLDYRRDHENEQFIIAVSDILAGLISRKQAESAINTHKAQLENLIDQRTAELHAAKDVAVAASRAKSAFLANMSHELRTPLQTILGAEHRVRSGSLTPQQTEWLDKQRIAGEHLMHVIDDILDLSRIEADKIALEEEPIEVLSVLQQVAHLIESQAHAKGLRIRLEAPGLPQRLNGDAGRLRQALLNYAGNAVKFTDAGEILLRGELVAEDADSATLRFEVTDTGIGIETDAMNRLFSAFEQADNGLTREYGGTGLGLAITRKIARLMGGDAGVQSMPGQGSTFWFTARLRKGGEANPVAPPSQADEPADAVLRRRFAGKRILVAEDDPANQGLFRELLSFAGLDVTIAEDGIRALQLADRYDFDIILMDMQMPRLDGLEAARQIRATPRGASVPILAMTGNAFAEDRDSCLAAGMNDFIAKPVLPPTLYASIAAWLGAGEEQKPPEI